MSLHVMGLQSGPCLTTEHQHERLARLGEHFDQALQHHPDTDVVILPELMTAPYFCTTRDPAFFALAEPLRGATFEYFSAKAREFGVFIIATLFESAEENGTTRYYNSAMLIDALGELRGVYRKTHIPTLMLESLNTDEAFYFSPGNDFPVFDIKGYRLGILICFDRSFPEAARTLARQGADLIVIPTASSGQQRSESWLAECAARARENGVYVIGVNRAGEERLDAAGSSMLSYFGLSCICRPDGKVEAALDDTPWQALHATLDPALIKATRAALYYPGFLRDELYHAQSDAIRRVRACAIDEAMPPLFGPEGAVHVEQ